MLIPRMLKVNQWKVKGVYCKEKFVTDINMKKHIAENHLATVTSEDSERRKKMILNIWQKILKMKI